MRIKEIEIVLKLVDEMPEQMQLRIAKTILREVERWEDQESLGVDDREYTRVCIRRLAKLCKYELPPGW